MHFSTVAASALLVGSALAGKYYETVYYTTVEDYETKVYTSIKTCKGKGKHDDKPTAKPEPVYYDPTYAPTHVVDPVETHAPYGKPVVYTKYAYTTVTKCEDYVVDCPAKIYTSTIYSTCSGSYAKPTDTYIPEEYDTPTYYDPPSNYSDPTPYYPEPTDYPVEYPVESAEPTYTTTIYTTVCPGEHYCYATTITTTWCPSKTHYSYPVEHPEYTKTYAHEYPEYTKTYEYPEHTKTYVPKPEYTKPAPCSGYDCPPAYNATTPTYVPPPSYTGAASTASFSFGVAAIAAVAALFIAA